MTDSTIDGKFLTFTDGWPNSQVLHAIPQDGFNGSSHHNVATPAYPPGTKITVYHDGALAKGAAGWVTFIYLKLGTANATTALAARLFVAPEILAANTADVNFHYIVSNDCDSPVTISTGVAQVAVAIGAMTNTYWGWFQCGGPPATDMVVSGTTYCLDSTFKTIGDVAGGSFMVTGSASGCMKLAQLGATTSLQLMVPCGYARAADS